METFKVVLLCFIFGWPLTIASQSTVSQVWVADKGDGTYRNPILHADYSDPDVCAVGDDFYMTASSFNCIPGLPVLHSKDLVNWTLLNYALPVQQPEDFFAAAQHGKGVWAPCIRYHNEEFYIYWGDPDFGIYMTRTRDVRGKWSTPVLVKAGKGLIDPTPLWDEDGKAYLAYARAGSRSGINSVITISEMNTEGTKIISDPVIVFDGNDGVNHTIEGPKLYKRNGFYYILAPAGGVEQGWQLALRSRSVYGPYEAKRVMEQGSSTINGPHQGGWVETMQGESWFVHFQDKAMYGRVVHLNPMNWKNDWPVIGIDKDGDGCGEPVTQFKKPKTHRVEPIITPPESDEFTDGKPGLQWQWHANYSDVYGMPVSSGTMRLFTNYLSPGFVNLWEAPSLLLQKFPAEEFSATAKIRFTAKEDGDRAGVIVMGWDYCHLSLVKQGSEVVLEQTRCIDAEKRSPEVTTVIGTFDFDEVYRVGSFNYMKSIYIRVKVDKGGRCTFLYSFDNTNFRVAGTPFTARQGKWIGAKIGLMAVKPSGTVNRGWMDVDWFRITKNDK